MESKVQELLSLEFANVWEFILHKKIRLHLYNNSSNFFCPSPTTNSRFVLFTVLPILLRFPPLISCIVWICVAKYISKIQEQ